jgi:hypothetical protein
MRINEVEYCTHGQEICGLSYVYISCMHLLEERTEREDTGHFKTQWSLYVPHSGHYMYRTVVTICTAQWSLYVPPV